MYEELRKRASEEYLAKFIDKLLSDYK
jgi:hypothetical protein